MHDSKNIFQLGTYLDLLAHQNPQMRILEVGAGTGSMTDIVLGYLGRGDDNPTERRYSQWDYTDISRSFFGEAQDTFILVLFQCRQLFQALVLCAASQPPLMSPTLHRPRLTLRIFSEPEL